MTALAAMAFMNGIHKVPTGGDGQQPADNINQPFILKVITKIHNSPWNDQNEGSDDSG